MSIESQPPQNNTPNLYRHHDIMDRLISEQALNDAIDDEFTKISHGLSLVDNFNESIKDKLIHVSMEVSALGIQIYGEEAIQWFTDERASKVTVTGLIGMVNYGRIAEREGFALYLVESNLHMQHPQTGEPLPVSVVAPIGLMSSYEYIDS
jgi:hypothetical protein